MANKYKKYISLKINYALMNSNFVYLEECKNSKKDEKKSPVAFFCYTKINNVFKNHLLFLQKMYFKLIL